MIRTSHPTQIDPPDLREFAIQAPSVATLEVLGGLEEFVVDRWMRSNTRTESRWGRIR